MNPYETPGGKKELVKTMQAETARDHDGETPQDSEVARLQSEVDKERANQPHAQVDPHCFSQAAMYSKPLRPFQDHSKDSSSQVTEEAQVPSTNDTSEQRMSQQSSMKPSLTKSTRIDTGVPSEGEDARSQSILVQGIVESAGEETMAPVANRTVQVSKDVIEAEQDRLNSKRAATANEFEKTPHFAVVDK
eukprot:gene12949-9263_t